MTTETTGLGPEIAPKAGVPGCRIKSRLGRQKFKGSVGRRRLWSGLGRGAERRLRMTMVWSYKVDGADERRLKPAEGGEPGPVE